MKRFRKALSLLIAFLIPFSSIQAFGLEFRNEKEQSLTSETEAPFSYTLEEGDLRFSELEGAVIDPKDVPVVISLDLVNERDHVKRLYAQEPDDNTVVFQNRNGSKTIYYFSRTVKQNGRDLAETEITERINYGISSVSLSKNRITFPKSSILPERLTQAGERRLNFYNIGYADIAEWCPDSRDIVFYDITASVRDWSVKSDGKPSFDMTSPGGDPVILSGGGMLMLSINYSDLPGDWAVKTVPESVGVTAKYLMNSYPTGGNSVQLSSYPSVPRTRWLITYEYGRYMLRSQSNQQKYLTGDESTGNVFLLDYDDDQSEIWDMERWNISFVSYNDGMIILKNEYSLGSYLCHSGTTIYLEDENYINYEERIWQLVDKNNNFTELSNFTIAGTSAIIKTGDQYSITCNASPSNATYQAYQMILPYPAEECDDLEFYSDSPVSGTVTVRYTYCPSKTCSFHVDIIDYPNSAVSFIQSGKAYELFAVDDTNHRSLHCSSETLSFTAYPQDSNANSFIFTYVSYGRYKICPESDDTKCLTYSSGNLSLSSYDSSSNQLWYPVLFNNRIYLANGAFHSKVISYSLSDSSISPCISSINDCHAIALPLAVPLYMQGTMSTCGPCNLSMVMNYYGLGHTETYIKNSILYHYNLNNGDPFSFYSNAFYLRCWSNDYSGFSGNTYSFSVVNYTQSEFESLLQANYSIGRPPICHVITNNSGNAVSPYLGYKNSGHYLTVKGLFCDGNDTYIIVNDSHHTYCGEKIIPISHFYQLVMNGHTLIVSGISS